AAFVTLRRPDSSGAPPRRPAPRSWKRSEELLSKTLVASSSSSQSRSAEATPGAALTGPESIIAPPPLLIDSTGASESLARLDDGDRGVGKLGGGVLRMEGGGVGLGSAPPDFFGGGNGLLEGGASPPRIVPGAEGTTDEALFFFERPSKTSRSLPLSSAIENPTPHGQGVSRRVPGAR